MIAGLPAITLLYWNLAIVHGHYENLFVLSYCTHVDFGGGKHETSDSLEQGFKDMPFTMHIVIRKKKYKKNGSIG